MHPSRRPGRGDINPPTARPPPSRRGLAGLTWLVRACASDPRVSGVRLPDCAKETKRRRASLRPDDTWRASLERHAPAPEPPRAPAPAWQPGVRASGLRFVPIAGADGLRTVHDTFAPLRFRSRTHEHQKSAGLKPDRTFRHVGCTWHVASRLQTEAPVTEITRHQPGACGRVSTLPMRRRLARLHACIPPSLHVPVVHAASCQARPLAPHAPMVVLERLVCNLCQDPLARGAASSCAPASWPDGRGTQ